MYPLLLDTRGVLIRMQMNEAKIRFESGEKGRQTLLRTSSRTSQVTEYRSSAVPRILLYSGSREIIEITDNARPPYGIT